MNACQIVTCGFFVACRTAPEAPDGVEEALDEIAFCVERQITVPHDLTV